MLLWKSAHQYGVTSEPQLLKSFFKGLLKSFGGICGLKANYF